MKLLYPGVIIFILLIITQTIFTKSKLNPQVQPINVSYCDLVNNPAQYDQKIIRIKAIYVYGFEGSLLYCPDCYQREFRTWVQVDESSSIYANPHVKKKFKGNDHKGRTLSVIMIGKFHGKGGGYGHENSYQFQLDLICIEEATVLAQRACSPSDLPKKLLQQINCNPSKKKN